MTPKQKALELCQKFGRTTLFAEDCNGGVTLPLRVAKLCALILVKEWYDYFEQEGLGTSYPDLSILQKEYWKQVKIEIEKL